MSYEPTTWKDGDLVTSAKLNKLEQGVAAGGGIQTIHFTHDNENTVFVSTETTAEVLAGLEAGIPQVWTFDRTGCPYVTIPDNIWLLIHSFQKWEQDGQVGYALGCDQDPIYANTPDFTGEHVIVEYYTDT